VKTTFLVAAVLGAACFTLAVDAGPLRRLIRPARGRVFVPPERQAQRSSFLERQLALVQEKKAATAAIIIDRPETNVAYKKEGTSPQYFRAEGSVSNFTSPPVLYSLVYLADDISQSWSGTMEKQPSFSDSSWHKSYVCVVESVDPYVKETETFSLSEDGTLVRAKPAKSAKKATPRQPPVGPRGKVDIDQPPENKAFKVGEKFTATGKLADDTAHLPLLAVMVSKRYPNQPVIIGKVNHHGPNWRVTFTIPHDAGVSDDYILRVGTLQGHVVPTDRPVKVRPR
jgi:hypothetical protein